MEENFKGRDSGLGNLIPVKYLMNSRGGRVSRLCGEGRPLEISVSIVCWYVYNIHMYLYKVGEVTRTGDEYELDVRCFGVH